MQYYNNEISKKYPQLLEYFKSGIYDENKNISHCLLFWGPDIQSQCELALDVARLLNCSKDGNDSCDCLNCKWVREQTHPAVKIYTRLDFKEGSSDEEETKGKKNINIAQAKSIISELSSDYHPDILMALLYASRRMFYDMGLDVKYKIQDGEEKVTVEPTHEEEVRAALVNTPKPVTSNIAQTNLGVVG